MSDTLFLMDMNLLLTRYFFALEERFNSDGTNINSIIPVLNIIDRLHKQGTVLCLFDMCRNNFRKELDSNYKINRTGLDPNLYLQTGMLIEFLKSINFNLDYSDTFEADDLIGSYSQIEDFENKIIYTADKDLIQLLSPSVKIFNPFKKNYYDNEYCITKYGVDSSQFALFLALCGDASDNITGIKNVGPKTAAKIINSNLEISNWQSSFPKYDFSSLDLQLSLSTINKSCPLKEISTDKINNFSDLYRSYFNL